MKKVCVIGWPIGHSRSPLIHNYWLKKYGIDAVYEKKPIESQNVANFVATLSTSEFIGCNVTIPHKETVFGTVDVADEIARRLGAVNTVYLRSNKVCGTNTDGEGFIASLHHSYPSFGLAGKTAIIIGAGGAAKAITGALLDENIEKIGIINRTRERIRSLQKQFGSRLFEVNAPIADHELKNCDLLINATSQGMEGQPPLELEIRNLNSNALVADIVYTPLETAFLKRAKDQGNSTLGGLGMLLHQAVRGFELWFGIKPEVTAELCELVAADVQKGAQAMITVGLTGSIAAGKSEVAKLFSSAGIPVFDSDAEVHELYAEKSTTDLIDKTFPDVIVNGSIDRQRLGQHVLESPEELKKLESLIHPLVKRSRERFICHWRKQNCPLVILDIPLLYETGEDQKLDYVVVVSANEEIQRNRAMTRPGMTREKLASILARQLPDSEKSRRADFVIENSASLEHLRKQVDALSKKLGELARSHKS